MSAVLRFIKTEAGGGLLLAGAAALALAAANSPLAAHYFNVLESRLTLDLGVWRHVASLKEWIKDGLMAVFFYVIGLELKRELTRGVLADRKSVLLPVAAAVGGALVPALIYAMLAGSSEPRGWPVPVATDIAFALAALAILAPKADLRLRVFLLAVAVVDDLLAIVLIALLFTSEFALAPLVAAAAALGALYFAGTRWTLPVWLYPAVALLCWALALESGVHTSVMAVAAALVTPSGNRKDGAQSPIGRLEQLVHPASAYVVLPIFAFSAAGVSLSGLHLGQIGGATGAIAIALAFGKPLGVTLFALACTRATGAALPFGLRDLISLGCLCGIGFTMSFFISGLAFADDAGAEAAARLGVLLGSSLSLIAAACAFRLRGRGAY